MKNLLEKWFVIIATAGASGMGISLCIWSISDNELLKKIGIAFGFLEIGLILVWLWIMAIENYKTK